MSDAAVMSAHEQYQILNMLIEFQEAMSKRAQSKEEFERYRQTILMLRMQQTHLTKEIITGG